MYIARSRIILWRKEPKCERNGTFAKNFVYHEFLVNAMNTYFRLEKVIRPYGDRPTKKGRIESIMPMKQML